MISGVRNSTAGMTQRATAQEVLTNNLANLGTQVRLFQKVPIVSGDKAKREWVFKRQRDGRDLKTEMKYFLLTDDRGDTGAVLGVQKSLEF